MGFKQVNTRIFSFQEEGDEVVGRYLRKETFDKGTLGDCQKYIIDTDQGRLSFVCGSAFDTQFVDAEILEGSMIKIIYHGKKDIGGGKKVNLFDLFVDEEDNDSV